MSLVFCDGFDHYATAQLGLKWSSVVGVQIAAVGRETNGAQTDGTQYNSLLTKGIVASGTLILGCAIKASSIPTSGNKCALLQLFDAGTPQFTVMLDSSGSVSAYAGSGSGSAIVTSAGGAITTATFTYLEVSVVLATSGTGSVSIRANNASIANAINVATAVTSDATSNSVSFNCGGTIGGSPYGSYILDDVYICNALGTLNNSFLGDLKVSSKLPNGNGRVDQLTRTGGTASGNYTAVDEVPPDGDTSYVSSATAGQSDCYTTAAITATDTVVAVQIVVDARKDDAGTRTIAVGFGNGTSEVYGANINPTNSYVMYTQPFDQNPVTSSAWTASAFNAQQLALTIIA